MQLILVTFLSDTYVYFQTYYSIKSIYEILTLCLTPCVQHMHAYTLSHEENQNKFIKVYVKDEKLNEGYPFRCQPGMEGLSSILIWAFSKA